MASPYSTPTTLRELSSLLMLVKTNSSRLRLGASSKQILQYMLDNPAYTAVTTMTRIAKKNHINPSTLTRLAHNLGFDKFSDFQQLFKTYFEENAHFYTRRANRLLDTAPKLNQSRELFETVINEEVGNLRSLTLLKDTETNQAIVNLFVKARKIRFYGRRQFFSLATFYAYCLGLIRERVDIMQDDVHGASHSLAFMNKKDLLVVLSCEPYTKATVDSCRIANKLDIPVIAFTDHPSSPLAQHARHHLIMPTETHFYSNSMAAAFSMAEALLAMTARQMGDSTLKTLKKREQIIEQFGITLPHNTPYRVT